MEASGLSASPRKESQGRGRMKEDPGQAKHTGRSPAGGGSKAEQVCSLLVVVPPSPLGLCDLWAPGHTKSRGSLWLR